MSSVAGPGWGRCGVCDVRLAPGRRCPNFWCHRDDRGFDVVWAAGEHRGDLRRAIAGLKYRNERQRARALGLFLARYLLEHAPCFDDIELIVATPGNVGRARPFDHTAVVLAVAAPLVGHLGEVDVPDVGHEPVLAKRAETRPMAAAGSAAGRRLWAAGDLRAALVVNDRARVRDRRILAVDDVFTDGSTLREVAGSLRRAGARAVSGVVLARQPLTGGPRGRAGDPVVH